MSVIIGMDPHKRSATIEVVDERGRVLAVGRFGTDKASYADMLAAGREYADRVWAVEDCIGIGKHIAHRLVHDGETVLDVPAKLSARVRVFATGNGRKTDPVDAHSVAMVALRSPNLVQVQVDPDLRRRADLPASPLNESGELVQHEGSGHGDVEAASGADHGNLHSGVDQVECFRWDTGGFMAENHDGSSGRGR